MVDVTSLGDRLESRLGEDLDHAKDPDATPPSARSATRLFKSLHAPPKCPAHQAGRSYHYRDGQEEHDDDRDLARREA